MPSGSEDLVNWDNGEDMVQKQHKSRVLAGKLDMSTHRSIQEKKYSMRVPLS